MLLFHSFTFICIASFHSWMRCMLLAFSSTSSSSSAPSSSSFYCIHIRAISQFSCISLGYDCVLYFVLRSSFLLYARGFRSCCLAFICSLIIYLRTSEWLCLWVCVCWCLSDRARSFGARPVQIPAYVRCKIAKNLSLSSWTKKISHKHN